MTISVVTDVRNVWNIRNAPTSTGSKVALANKRLMPPRALILCIVLALGGCGILDEGLRDMKSHATEAISDLIPTWMGGLPSSAPPRPDDPKYAQWLKAQQEEAARPKNDKKDDTPKPEPQSSEAPTD